jgi:hypothetical protein
MRGWRKVKGFENYRVMRCGCVATVNVDKSDGEKKWKFIKSHYNNNFYLRVELWKQGVRYWHFVHRLVGLHFKKNPNPKSKDQINHKNYVRVDCMSYNLEWCTGSENQIHARKRPFGINKYGEKYLQSNYDDVPF